MSLPRHLRGRLLQPGGEPGRRPRGREREPGQRAQLAAPDLPDRGRRLAGPVAARRCSASARSSTCAAGSSPGFLRVQDLQGRTTRGHPAPLRLHGRPPPGRPGDDGVPENWSGRLVVRSALDGQVTNAGVARYRASGASTWPGSAAAPATTSSGCWWRRAASRIQVALAARTRAGRGTGGPPPNGGSWRRPAWSPSSWSPSPRGRAGHRGEGGGAVHLAGPGHRRAGRRRPRPWPGCPTASTRCWSATPWPGTTCGGAAGSTWAATATRGGPRPQPARVPPAPDRVRAHHRPRRRGAGPGPARRGLPGPRLLGRAVHLPVPQPALPRADPGAAASTGPGGCPRPARRPGRAGCRGRCTPGRAAATAARRASGST